MGTNQMSIVLINERIILFLITKQLCYEAFMRMVREWCYLKMLKRAGRGHDPAGVKATQPEELAVLCPACPHPGINLPDGWKDVPLWARYVGTTNDGLTTDNRMLVDGCSRCSWLLMLTSGYSEGLFPVTSLTQGSAKGRLTSFGILITRSIWRVVWIPIKRYILKVYLHSHLMFWNAEEYVYKSQRSE